MINVEAHAAHCRMASTSFRCCTTAVVRSGPAHPFLTYRVGFRSSEKLLSVDGRRRAMSRASLELPNFLGIRTNDCVCVLRSFYPSISSTSSVCTDSVSYEGPSSLCGHNYDTKLILRTHRKMCRKEVRQCNAMPAY